MKNYSQGNALVGIIVIILVLLAAGMSFYTNTKKQVLENKASQERAKLELNANVFESVQ